MYMLDADAQDGTQVFKNVAYALNPGVERSFPWLPQIAQNFTEYKWIQLVFEWVPTQRLDLSNLT
jgi:hypothetical protein